MSPSTATRSRARCRSPRNTPPCACGSSGPAAPRVRPWSWRRTLGRCPPRSRRTRLRAAPLAGGRRTRGPVSAASRTTSPSGRPDDPPADPSPQPNSSPISTHHRLRSARLRQRAVNRRLLRQPCQILARLGLLLAGHFELISNVSELLGAISLSLRMSRDLTERRHPALLNLLRLGSCSEQLLHQILKLLGALRLLLPGLKLLLDRGKLRLSLIARLCRFA